MTLSCLIRQGPAFSPSPGKKKEKKSKKSMANKTYGAAIHHGRPFSGGEKKRAKRAERLSCNSLGCTTFFVQIFVKGEKRRGRVHSTSGPVRGEASFLSPSLWKKEKISTTIGDGSG